MPSSPAPARFVALEIGSRIAAASAVDGEGQVVLQPCAVALDQIETWARQHLRPTDALVIDTPASAWEIHDLLAPLVASVTVAHPQLASLLPGCRNGAAPRAAIKLAQLHAAGLVPALWVPPRAVRDLRAMTAHRGRLLAQRSAARDMLERLLRDRGLAAPGATRLGSPRWWAALDLTADERRRAREGVASYNRATTLLADVEKRLARQSGEDCWKQMAAALLDVPGMSELGAMIVLAGIGEIARFPEAAQLVGYAGLVGGRRDDGARGADGRRELRAAMLDAARAAVRTDAAWRAAFTDLEREIGAGRAMVAIARRLLVVVWDTLAAEAGQQPVAAQTRKAA